MSLRLLHKENWVRSAKSRSRFLETACPGRDACGCIRPQARGRRLRGAGIGAAIIALGEYLKASGAKWRTPVLAAAVGIYLPLDLTTPIFLGGLLTSLVVRRLGVVKDDHDAKDRVHRKGVLFSAGLITGEALIGIFMAIPIVASGKADVLALPAMARHRSGRAYPANFRLLRVRLDSSSMS